MLKSMRWRYFVWDTLATHCQCQCAPVCAITLSNLRKHFITRSSRYVRSVGMSWSCSFWFFVEEMRCASSWGFLGRVSSCCWCYDVKVFLWNARNVGFYSHVAQKFPYSTSWLSCSSALVSIVIKTAYSCQFLSCILSAHNTTRFFNRTPSLI